MDYWANVDAVTWFATEVFPLVLEARPRARFYVVGSRPVAAVRRLEQRPGVHVTGTVPDVRPYLAHAGVAVAPLRIARGVQNKVLEAMAMARPVIATAAALEGIEPTPTPGTLRVDHARAMAEQVLWCLSEPAAAIALGAAGRASVERHYDWATNLARFTELLEGGASPQQPAARRPTADLETREDPAFLRVLCR
jgi:glycosyltransferase involved in cell wall biosynthesis